MNISNQVIAPRQFGNPYFDRMSCPLDILPETFTIHYRTGNGVIVKIDLPTRECAHQGNFISRKYTGVSFKAIEKALNARGIFYKSVIYKPGDGIDIVADPSYKN